MRKSNPVIPWVSPKLSPSLVGLISSIGRVESFNRGEKIYSSGDFFRKLCFIRSGVVAKAIIDPRGDDVMQLSLAGPGSLCGCYEDLYFSDRLPRRHWALTKTELLVVSPEVLLRICDQSNEWQQELWDYPGYCMRGERFGMYLNRSKALEERLAVLTLMWAYQFNSDLFKSINDPGVLWFPLKVLPPRITVAKLIEASLPDLSRVYLEWVMGKFVKYRLCKIYLSAEYFRDFLHDLHQPHIR